MILGDIRLDHMIYSLDSPTELRHRIAGPSLEEAPPRAVEEASIGRSYVKFIESGVLFKDQTFLCASR